MIVALPPAQNAVELELVPDKVGFTFTVIAAVLPVDNVLLQFELFFIDVIVIVVEPLLANADVVKVPLLPVKLSDDVLPVALLAPLKLYVTVYVPLARDVEPTVTVEVLPAHTFVAPVVLKLLTAGFALVVNEAVLVLKALEQLVLVNLIDVIFTTLFVPAVFNAAVVNVPPAPLVATVMEAVVELTVFVPLTLYVTV